MTTLQAPITTAIILAAGRGSRMGDLTTHIPKPLIPVLGKPIMEYLVELLVAHGVTTIGINLHYQGESIRKHFGNGSRFGAQIIYVEEDNLTGTAGGTLAVARALELEEPFFVLSGDMLVNFDLTALAHAHLSSKGIATLSCYERPRDQLKKSGVVLFDEFTHKILQFVERPQTLEECPSCWVNSSIYAFSPNLLSSIPQSSSEKPIIDLPRDIFPLLMSQGESLYAYPFRAPEYYQLGMDTPERVARAEADIRDKRFIPTLMHPPIHAATDKDI